MEESEIYAKAIALWGKEFQKDMMIEEASELIKVLLKERRSKTYISEIIEEIVDCQIVLDQMKIIFSETDMYDRLKEYKLRRLEKMVTKA
jgi:hypothetical protein